MEAKSPRIGPITFPNTHMHTDRALEKVQTLYVMQIQLLDLLDRDLSDPVVRKEVKSHMKQFQTLLAQADWRYMGGEDVWEALKSLPQEMARKLKESSLSTTRTKKPVKKAVKVIKAKSPMRSMQKTKRFAKTKKRK